MRLNYLSKIVLVVSVALFGCYTDHKVSSSKTMVEQGDTITMFKLNENSNTDYCVYILNNRIPKVKGQQFQEKSFYSCDASLIRARVKKFKGVKSEGLLKCGYDYNMVFTFKNRVVETASINYMCGFALTDKGAFFFNQVDFDSLIIGMNSPTIKQFYPKNIYEARRLWEENIRAVNYVPVFDEPDWLRYDGEFYLKLDSLDWHDRESQLSKLRAIIQLQYPTDTFAFGNWTSVKSTKSFYKRYSLTDKEDWQPYSNFDFNLVYKND